MSAPQTLMDCIDEFDNHNRTAQSLVSVLEMQILDLETTCQLEVNDAKALLIDSTHAELKIVDNFTVEVGYVGDDFTNNLATILGEMRVIPVFRTVGAMRLITPKA